MNVDEPIYSLRGVAPYLGEIEIASKDMKSLQIILTNWLRCGGNGFIWRMR